MPSIYFYYDFVSPFSYLAATQVPHFAHHHNVAVKWVPVLLPQLMKLANNTSPATVPKKGLYLLRDLRRWAEYLGVPFTMQKPPFFDARPALLAAQALHEKDRQIYSLTVFQALWARGARPDHDAWVSEIVIEYDLPAAWADPKDPARLMTELRENTETAFKAGAFGAPTFVLKGAGKPQLYWGVDRMDFLGRAVDKAS